MTMKLLTVVFATMVSAAVAQDTLPEARPVAAPAANNAEFLQKANYALGLDLGRSLKNDGVPLDLQSLFAGIQAGAQDAQPRWSEQELAATMQQLNQLLQQKQQERAQMASKTNKERGEVFLAENAKQEGVVKTDSGLQYKVLKRGDGESPKLQSTVRCHYKGTTIDGEEFDSSYRRGEPAEFPVAGVIAGWTEALQMMKVGDKYQLVIPSNLAYGERGAGGAIGPNETLIFEVELLGIAR